MVTNDHTTYDSQKQAAEAVSINKHIHYTQKRVYMYIWKGENPSLDITAGAKCYCYNNRKSTK